MYEQVSPGRFRASDVGVIACNFDPKDATVSGGSAPAGGFIYLMRFQLWKTQQIQNQLIFLNAVGAGLVANQNFAGIYDFNGNLIAETADQSGAWASTGIKVMPLTPQGGHVINPLPGSSYWAALLMNATTVPKISWCPQSLLLHPGRGGTYTAAIPGAQHRAGYISVGGKTSLPASIAGLTVTDSSLLNMPWVGFT